jgi:hypothetical protein
MSKPNKLPAKHNNVELKWLDKYAKLLDSQFSIPGTNITFGIDPIIGMLPVVGDIVSYLMSALLIFYSAKYGASGKVIFKMFWNALLDFLLSKIPVLGYFIDFAFKANERNLRLLKEHYNEEKHQGSILPYLLGALLFFGVIVIVSLWLTLIVMNKFVSWISN